MTTEHQDEYRCDCGKLLFKSPYFIGQIEIKCRRCGRIKVFEESAGEQVEPRTESTEAFAQ